MGMTGCIQTLKSKPKNFLKSITRNLCDTASDRWVIFHFGLCDSWLFSVIPCSKFTCSILAFGQNRGDRTPIEHFADGCWEIAGLRIYTTVKSGRRGLFVRPQGINRRDVGSAAVSCFITLDAYHP